MTGDKVDSSTRFSLDSTDPHCIHFFGIFLVLLDWRVRRCEDAEAVNAALPTFAPPAKENILIGLIDHSVHFSTVLGLFDVEKML